VLGATTPSLILLLIKEFSVLISVAFLLAIPLAYFGMTEWLSSFPYRENINPLLFVLAGVISIAVAVLTVSYQSFKAARINPVQSLANQ